jgi:hypothetical protein
VFEDAEPFVIDEDRDLFENNVLPSPPMVEVPPVPATPTTPKPTNVPPATLNEIPEGDEETKYFDVEWGTKPTRTKSRRKKRRPPITSPREQGAKRYNLRSRGGASQSMDLSFRRIMSADFSHIEYLTNTETIALATLDWEYVSDDWYCRRFDEMFTTFYNEETMELLDSNAIHPFALASKLHNEDFPSYKDILRMSPEERNKWMDSMDEELQALYEFGTFEFIPRSEVEEGEQIVPVTCDAIPRLA